jgi:hypothetical protein
MKYIIIIISSFYLLTSHYDGSGNFMSTIASEQTDVPTSIDQVDKSEVSVDINYIEVSQLPEIDNNLLDTESNQKDLNEYNVEGYQSDDNPVTYDEDKNNFPAYQPHTYDNVDNIEVQAPTHYNNIPHGANARCGDGSYSLSKNRRGTCSRHGGVSEWLK